MDLSGNRMSEPITTAAVTITAKAVLIHGAVAIGGAIAHALNAHRAGNSKTLWDFLALTIISSFSGVMFFFLGFHVFGEENYLTLVLAGSGGWLGIEGMSMIVEFIKKSIRANFIPSK